MLGVPAHFPIYGQSEGFFMMDKIWGTSSLSNMWYFRGIFVRYFLWEGFYIVFLAYDNGMVPR